MPTLTPEERLGARVAERYRLVALRSRGGMGLLYEAEDERTGTRVAVKVLRADPISESDGIERFLRETRIAASLRHPNIVATLDTGVEETGAPFLVMELLEGQSLSARLSERERLSLSETLAVALPIAEALGVAHAAGVIHRDLKPGNIFLHRSAHGEVPKLLDFGIAKTDVCDFETRTGVLMGTPGYMAPEHAIHGECHPASDVWALGAVVYACLTGAPPHSCRSVPELLARLARDPVPPLSVDGVGPRASATIDRALATDPARRYRSMVAFADALRALTSIEDDASPTANVSSAPPMPAEPDAKRAPPRDHQPSFRSRRARWRNAATLLTLAAAFVTTVAWRWRYLTAAGQPVDAATPPARVPGELRLAERAVERPERARLELPVPPSAPQNPHPIEAAPRFPARTTTSPAASGPGGARRPARVGAAVRSDQAEAPVGAEPSSAPTAPARDVAIDPDTGLPIVTAW